MTIIYLLTFSDGFAKINLKLLPEECIDMQSMSHFKQQDVFKAMKILKLVQCLTCN